MADVTPAEQERAQPVAWMYEHHPNGRRDFAFTKKDADEATAAGRPMEPLYRATALAEQRKRGDRLEAALREARPVVYNSVCSARAENQPWQVDVRQKILDQVDAEIGKGAHRG